ncbi:hypothetical protein PMIN03_001438 [Paraphaeosphaeria minitans]
MRGGRHIVVYEDALGGDNAIETWNRLENGEISGRVMLNSTYGTDQYARVEVKFSDGSTPKKNVVGNNVVQALKNHNNICREEKYDYSGPESDQNIPQS